VQDAVQDKRRILPFLGQKCRMAGKFTKTTPYFAA
jgi:hypothetical protein